MPRSTVLASAAALLLALLPVPAQAFRLPHDLGPIAGDPANALAALPIDPETYDPATHCDPMPHKGVEAMVRWLTRHTRGVFWGSYRCEQWGPHSASLHAENRAIDWHPASRADAARLIDLLLAPDSAGNPHALARRMGVEELIWDCSYWGAGAPDFGTYDYCYGRGGVRRKHLDPTQAHLNHVHIGMSIKGARAQTSFWKATLG
jgi:hypothetical protein